MSNPSTEAPPADPDGTGATIVFPGYPPPKPLPQNRSFWAYLVTQAMGAFNDNIFKQAVLLMAVTAIGSGLTQTNYQAYVAAAFSAPFIIFSGIAGDIADRFSKGRVIVACKIAEILVMTLATLAFLLGEGETGLILLTLLAFVMGSQSAFFGPPKYGSIPEMVRMRDLPKATGLTQMTTMISIILGLALAGILMDAIGANFWIVGVVCIGVAVVGTWTSLGIMRYPAANPDQPLTWRSSYSVFPTLGGMVTRDHLLLLVVLVYSYFWFLGAVSLPLLNDLGELQLGLDKTGTSILSATISLGIGLGGAVGGFLSRGTARLSLCFIAMLLLGGGFLWMGTLDLPEPPPSATTTDGAFTAGAAVETETAASEGEGDSLFATQRVPQSMVWTVLVILFLLGLFAGVYMVPLLAFIQFRPAGNGKGRTIAAANFSNWVLIFASAFVYNLLADVSTFRVEASFEVLGIVNLGIALLVIPFVLRLKAREGDKWIGTFHISERQPSPEEKAAAINDPC